MTRSKDSVKANEIKATDKMKLSIEDAVDKWQNCDMCTLDFEDYLRQKEIPEALIKIVTRLNFERDQLWGFVSDISRHSRGQLNRLKK